MQPKVGDCVPPPPIMDEDDLTTTAPPLPISYKSAVPTRKCALPHHLCMATKIPAANHQDANMLVDIESDHADYLYDANVATLTSSPNTAIKGQGNWNLSSDTNSALYYPDVNTMNNVGNNYTTNPFQINVEAGPPPPPPPPTPQTLLMMQPQAHPQLTSTAPPPMMCPVITTNPLIIPPQTTTPMPTPSQNLLSTLPITLLGMEGAKNQTMTTVTPVFSGQHEGYRTPLDIWDMPTTAAAAATTTAPTMNSLWSNTIHYGRIGVNGEGVVKDKSIMTEPKWTYEARHIMPMAMTSATIRQSGVGVAQSITASANVGMKLPIILPNKGINTNTKSRLSNMLKKKPNQKIVSNVSKNNLIVTGENKKEFNIEDSKILKCNPLVLQLLKNMKKKNVNLLVTLLISQFDMDYINLYILYIL